MRRIAPRAIRFTNDYRIGSPTREGLRLAPGMDRVPFDPAAVREQIATAFGHALKLRQVSAGGDASVEMELNATATSTSTSAATASNSPLRPAMPTAWSSPAP